MRVRPTTIALADALVVRGLLALAVVAAFTTIALLPRAATHSYADGPTSVIYGFIRPDAQGAYPTKVRALGEAVPGREAPVCGTGDVIDAGNGTRFYLLSVASDVSHTGCPTEGGDIRFLLLYGAVDPGIGAAQVARWSGSPQQVDLSPVAETVSIGAFTGALPAGPGYALLTWNGADGTPIADALLSIPRQVQVVFRLSANSVQRYVVGAPDFVSDLRTLDHGDIVAVLIK